MYDRGFGGGGLWMAARKKGEIKVQGDKNKRKGKVKIASNTGLNALKSHLIRLTILNNFLS